MKELVANYEKQQSQAEERLRVAKVTLENMDKHDLDKIQKRLSGQVLRYNKLGDQMEELRLKRSALRKRIAKTKKSEKFSIEMVQRAIAQSRRREEAKNKVVVT